MTDSSEQPNSKSIYMDQSYFRTTPGILKAASMVLDLLGFICMVTTLYSYVSWGSFYNFVSMLGFWYTGVMLLLECFHITEKWTFFPWTKVQLGFSAVIALFFFIASTICATHVQLDQALAASAFFGYCAMVLYGYETWRLFTTSNISFHSTSNAASSPHAQA